MTLFPCHECVKLLIQSGIKEVVYYADKYNNTESNIAAKKMLDAAKIKYRKFDGLILLNEKQKLLILIIPIYALLIISLIVPVGGYKMDLPGNIQPISKEIEFEDLESSGEFYSIYIISSKPTLFRCL